MLTNRNSKLGDKIFNYNLPRTTCIKFRTALCQKYCYAKSGRFCYKKVKEHLERQVIETKQRHFAKLIIAQLALLKIQVGLKKVRLHSIGDFYSEKYYKQWNEIAMKNKDITFLAYTRNPDIDFSKRAKNFKIYFSRDDSTRKVNPSLKLNAYVIDGKELKTLSHMAYVKKFNGRICNSKCHSCSFCFNNEKYNVVFPRR